MIKKAVAMFAPCWVLWVPGVASAQGQSSPDKWQFEASAYGWFPSIGGSTSFPAIGSGPNIKISASQLIDSLKFTFMGSIEARKGDWGLWSDLVYTDVGDTETLSGGVTVSGQPVTVAADLGLDIKSWIWTLAGTYRLAKTPDADLHLLGGLRYLDMQQTLAWRFSADIPQLPDRNGTARVEESHTDGVVGLKGRVLLGADRKWFLPYYADIGAGQSKLTGQLVAGVGRQFEWGSMVATWRYLDYEFKSGELIRSLRFSGPTVGASLQW